MRSLVCSSLKCSLIASRVQAMNTTKYPTSLNPVNMLASIRAIGKAFIISVLDQQHSSYDGISRSYNVASIRQYIEGWEQGKRIYERECLTEEEKRHEYIMTRLRTQWGIDLADYVELFGASARERLIALSEPFISRGQLCLDAHTLKLSPQGVFTSDGIIAELFD